MEIIPEVKMEPTFLYTNEQVEALLKDAYKGRINNLPRSIELAERALAISREMNAKALIGQSLNQLSLYFMIMGDYGQSTLMSEEAIRYFEELDDERGIADAKYSIAGVYYKTDNFHLGLVYLIDALKIYQKHNDYHNQSRVEKSIGTIYEYFGDQNNAIISYKNAIAAAKQTGDLNLESNAYNNLSGVLIKQNKIEEALAMIEKSITMKKQTGDTRGYAFAIYGRGKVYTHTRQFPEAEQDFLEAIKTHREMGERLGLGMAYNKLGALYMEMARLDKAKEIANEGFEFSSSYNIAIIKYKCLYLLYNIHKVEGAQALALEYLERYLKEREAVINTQTLKVIENYEIIVRMKTLEKEAELQKEKAEIIEKKNRAEEAARIRQEFLSTMSHEIRTPLNAVTTIVALLHEQADEENKSLLSSLRFASNNLLRVINDILDFTRLDSFKAQLETHPTKFKSLCENIWRTYDSMAKAKGIRLALKFDIALNKTYLLDETKITQILGNLITNAIKFTESGKVEIEIELLAEEKSFDRLLFKVTDTGEGIPGNDLPEIFKSFSQIKNVMTRKQGGTGLGLAIVQKLVELHGSKIEVESTVGKGSVFYFELGLVKVFEAKSDQAGQLEGKNALLAEDTEINAFLIMKLLSKWGVVTEHVVTGKQAFEKSKQKPYDFILMDIHMPEMNGFEATRHIRIDENLNMQTPIFAVTSDIMARNNKEYAPYFNGFLSKPLEIEKLYTALAQVGVEA
jgi:signal transduction histidine kinase/CheY-like chemotaxis protein